MNKAPRLRVGSKVGDALTVLGVIDTGGHHSTVYIVWHHRSWCPMACKLYPCQADAEAEAGNPGRSRASQHRPPARHWAPGARPDGVP